MDKFIIGIYIPILHEDIYPNFTHIKPLLTTKKIREYLECINVLVPNLMNTLSNRIKFDNNTAFYITNYKNIKNKKNLCSFCNTNPASYLHIDCGHYSCNLQEYPCGFILNNEFIFRGDIDIKCCSNYKSKINIVDIKVDNIFCNQIYYMFLNCYDGKLDK